MPQLQDLPADVSENLHAGLVGEAESPEGGMIRLLFSNLWYRFTEWQTKPVYTYVDLTKVGR